MANTKHRFQIAVTQLPAIRFWTLSGEIDVIKQFHKVIISWIIEGSEITLIKVEVKRDFLFLLKLKGIFSNSYSSRSHWLMSKTLGWWSDKRLNHLCGGSCKATFSQFDFSDQAGVLISSHCQIPDGSLQKSFKCILYLKKKRKSKIRATALINWMIFHSRTVSCPNVCWLHKFLNLAPNINSCHGNVIKPNIKHLFNTEMHIFLTNVCKQISVFDRWPFVRFPWDISGIPTCAWNEKTRERRHA